MASHKDRGGFGTWTTSTRSLRQRTRDRPWAFGGSQIVTQHGRDHHGELRNPTRVQHSICSFRNREVIWHDWQTRILVVDDEENLRRVTQLKLQQAGYEALTASRCSQALEVLSSIPRTSFSTDLKMPGMSGIDLLRKGQEEYPEVIVVVVTAYGTIESAVEAMRLGAYIHHQAGQFRRLKLIVSGPWASSAPGRSQETSLRNRPQVRIRKYRWPGPKAS